MQRLMIWCAVGLGLLFGTFAPAPASAYDENHHHNYHHNYHHHHDYHHDHHDHHD